MTWRIEAGDARAVLAGWPAGSAQCVCTSPPYWGLRNYQTAPQIWGDCRACLAVIRKMATAVGEG